MMTDLILPNIVGDFNAGYDRGQGQQFNRLAGQAVADPTNTNALNQAAQIDPMAAQKIQLVQQAQQANQQQAQQAQQVDHNQKLNGAANYMIQALQSKNPNQIQGAWQAVAPYLQQLTGKQTPAQWDPAMEPALYQAAAATGGTPQVKGVVVGPGSVLNDSATGNVLFRNPANMQYQGAVPTGAVDPATGASIVAAGGVDPQTMQFRPVTMAPGAAGRPAAPSGAAGLPAETQAYVPKVMGALAGAQPFDANGQPTPQLLDAVMKTESGGNPNAVSSAGAQGAYQLMPATAASVGVANPMDPTQSRAGAAQYLAQLYKQFGGNTQLALAAYNAGPGRVTQAMAGQPGVAGSGGSVAGNAPPVAGAPQPLAFGQSVKSGPKEKAPNGYRFSADGQSLEPIPGGPADKGGASNVTLGDATKTGDAYLQTVPDAGMQGLIKAIAEGRMQIPKIYRAGKAGEIGPTQIAQAVAQYDPTYDQGDPASRLKSRNDFTSGASAKQLQQLNTLLGHLGGLADAADKLHNSSVPLYNTMANAVESGTGNQAVTNFNSARDPAAEEFAALLKGGVPAEGEIQAAKANLSANNSPAQLRGSIGTMAAQVQSRIAALQQRAATGLGPFASKVPIITPEGQAALDKLRNAGYIGKFDLGEAGSQAQPSQAQPSQSGWSIQRVQ